MAKVLAPDDPKNQPFQDTPFKVWEVERHARLTSTKKKLNEKLGKGNWGLTEVVQDLTAIRERRRMETSNTRRKAQQQDAIQGRLDKYLVTFKDVTPNDEQSIIAMCNLEIQMEGVEKELALRTLDVDSRKKLGELYAKLSTEHRQLQAALGITRSERESEMDTQAEIKRFIHGAKQKIEEEGVLIACPNCSEKMALNQGFVMFHFRDNVRWKWESQCPNPKCKKMFTIQSENFEQPESVKAEPVPF